MKLTVAVGILSANSLPAVVAEAKKSSGGQQLWTTSKKDRRWAIGSTRSNGLGLRPSPTKFMNGASWRSSSRGSTINSITECIPEESAAVADVGALGRCGSGQMCVANVDSSLGGLCTTNTVPPLTGRRLQVETNIDICDPTSRYYPVVDCDCSSFDLATKTGTISCSEGPYCFGTVYYGCYNTCLTIAKTFSFENGESTSIDICNEFVATGEVPVTSSLCTYSTGDYETCEITLDGQKCTSCTPDFPRALSFDCSNIAEGVKVDPEDDYYRERFPNLPIIQECRKPVDGTSCNLCGVDFAMDVQNDTGTVLSLDGFGDALTCTGLHYANLHFQIPSDKCIEASAVAKAECCVEMCDICPGRDLYFIGSAPHDPINVTALNLTGYYGETTCDTVAAALYPSNSIPAYICASLRGEVGDTCCTDSRPIGIPIEEPTIAPVNDSPTAAPNSPAASFGVPVWTVGMMLAGASFMMTALN